MRLNQKLMKNVAQKNMMNSSIFNKIYVWPVIREMSLNLILRCKYLHSKEATKLYFESFVLLRLWCSKLNLNL